MNKILIVDDNQQNLYMLEILLKTNSFEVELASNGVEALEKAHRNLPDLIISDILMPVMDGFSLCRAWKADAQLQNIPFIFYTATYTDPKDEEFALRLDADRFLIKPMDPEDLLGNIRDVLQKKITRTHPVLQEPIQKEEEYYKEYSETLIRKLEEKVMQVEQTKKRLAALYQISCNLISIKSSTDLVHSSLKSIVETVGYEQANYFSYDDNQKMLYLNDYVGLDDQVLEGHREQLNFKLGEKSGWVGAVGQDKKPVNISDTTKDANWIAIDKTIMSALFIPVSFENVLQGVVGLFSNEKNSFSVEDENNIQILANVLAISIENIKTEEHISQLNAVLEQRVSERTAQLALANQELEAFTYSVSHDLRAPLRGIDGWSHVLLEDYFDKLDDEGKQSLKYIRSEVQRMGVLIENLLELSRITRKEMHREKINLSELAQRIIQRLRMEQPRPDVEVVIQPDMIANGDGPLLDVVLTNLLNNAWKYTGKCLKPSIEFGQSELDGQRTYFVRDNGVGFDMTYAGKLFGVFQRMHPSSEFPGTGIGLATVQRIILRHGGGVWADAKVNQGATFYFTLEGKE
jgi:signal transduction histidine kinase/CheY-like chemotaxis protein